VTKFYKNVHKYDLLNNSIVSKNIAFYCDYTQNENEIDIIATILDDLFYHAYNTNNTNALIEILNESINYVREYTNDPTQYADITDFDDAFNHTHTTISNE
jgi:hypothetical protein